MPLQAPEQETDQTPVSLKLIDCDIHPSFPKGLFTLAPYLSMEWRRKLGVMEQRPSWAASLSNSGFSIPKNDVYNILSGGIRMDAIPEDAVPASTPQMVAEQHLDPLGIDRGILLTSGVFGLGAVPNAHTAAAIASATNDWLDNEWLQVDERFRASIIVAPQDPVAAAAEVRRMADRPGVVQIFMPSDYRLMGDPHFYPLYEAAAESNLPIAVHPTGIEGMYTNGPKLGGVPSYHIEWHTLLTMPSQANVVSMVAHGVFERFPNLRVVLTESGIGWLLELMWRMDKNWKGLRDEVPWLKRRPSEYMLEHFRFTTQPLLEPDRREHLHSLLEMVQAEKVLMFSTDFPHWDGDDPQTVLNLLPAHMRERVAAQTAIELYGERLA
ncbi:amidohydrolase family protein [Rhodococcus rhodochrous]|uniref:amidohydrolase family protein n=1 Tax=Rhodococcus rhodochrous TaxID=1829 RepID=UPI0009C06969|nr:amidohydrolase family protein [Rhodococcus rhodochrous]